MLWPAVPQSRSAADVLRWRSCRAAPLRLRPMASIPDWVCGRRCRVSLHPSSSAVIRLVASGQQTKQRSAQQLLHGSARWPAAVGVLRPAVTNRVCSRSGIGGVADGVVGVGSSPSGPGISQSSQAHAHRRGMEISRNTDYPEYITLLASKNLRIVSCGPSL